MARNRNEGVEPHCPNCGSDQVHRIDGSSDGAHCRECDHVFVASWVAFDQAVDELYAALAESMCPPLMWIVNGITAVIERVERARK